MADFGKAGYFFHPLNQCGFRLLSIGDIPDQAKGMEITVHFVGGNSHFHVEIGTILSQSPEFIK